LGRGACQAIPIGHGPGVRVAADTRGLTLGLMRPHAADEPCPWVENYGPAQAEKLARMFMGNGWSEERARWAAVRTGRFVTACPRVEDRYQADNQRIATSYVRDWGRSHGWLHRAFLPLAYVRRRSRPVQEEGKALLASVDGELACWREVLRARKRETGTAYRRPEQGEKLRAYMADYNRRHDL
jgi:hypothetical protein